MAILSNPFMMRGLRAAIRAKTRFVLFRPRCLMGGVCGIFRQGARRKMREMEGTHMEMDSITSRTELICADCGVRFRARRVVDGVEEICDGCYEKRFPAREPSGAILHRRRHSLAAD